MADEVCKKCGMPMESEDEKCSCKVGVCKYCCSCPSDCSCGCQIKSE